MTHVKLDAHIHTHSGEPANNLVLMAGGCLVADIEICPFHWASATFYNLWCFVWNKHSCPSAWCQNHGQNLFTGTRLSAHNEIIFMVMMKLRFKMSNDCNWRQTFFRLKKTQPGWIIAHVPSQSLFSLSQHVYCCCHPPPPPSVITLVHWSANHHLSRCDGRKRRWQNRRAKAT